MPRDYPLIFHPNAHYRHVAWALISFDFVLYFFSANLDIKTCKSSTFFFHQLLRSNFDIDQYSLKVSCSSDIEVGGVGVSIDPSSTLVLFNDCPISRHQWPRRSSIFVHLVCVLMPRSRPICQICLSRENILSRHQTWPIVWTSFIHSQRLNCRFVCDLLT